MGMWPWLVFRGLCGSLSPVLSDWRVSEWEMMIQFGRSEGNIFPGPGARTSAREETWISVFWNALTHALLRSRACVSICQSSPFSPRSLLSILTCSVFFLHSLFSLSFRDLAVIPVEKPPTHGARGSQLGKTPELLAALNRSPTQHHYLLQLHKCWFPITSTLPELHTPMRARTTAEPRVQSKTPARNSINCTRARTTLHR